MMKKKITLTLGIIYFLFLIAFLSPSTAYTWREKRNIPYAIANQLWITGAILSHGTSDNGIGIPSYIDFSVEINEGPYPIAPKIYRLHYVQLYWDVSGHNINLKLLSINCYIILSDGENSVMLERNVFTGIRIALFCEVGRLSIPLSLTLPETTRGVSLTVITIGTFLYGLIPFSIMISSKVL
ncbi:MAG: hypothetical protein JXA99_15630 [Candidatus Lokiarchaeota archaeon]|nr:hypothetical protein [Candidatus Lokiarchaeota archaeon]